MGPTNLVWYRSKTLAMVAISSAALMLGAPSAYAAPTVITAQGTLRGLVAETAEAFFCRALCNSAAWHPALSTVAAASALPGWGARCYVSPAALLPGGSSDSNSAGTERGLLVSQSVAACRHIA